ncbi:hypothetical protein HK097_000434, partial [Rhizophlyctis rosea]
RKRKWLRAEDQIVVEEVAKAEEEGRKPRWKSTGLRLGIASDSVPKRWTNVLDPRLIKLPFWTSNEDVQICRAVEHATSEGCRVSWMCLSRELKRPSASIRTRWLKLACRNVEEKEWSSEEDALVYEEGVRALRANRSPNWAKLSLGKRIPKISDRWWAKLHPKLVQGKWTNEMKKDVVEAVRRAQLEGMPVDWRGLGRLIGKGGTNVRLTWSNSLNPSLKHGKWSQAEVVMLVQLRKNGLAWTAIGHILHRAPITVLRKHRQVTKC